MCVADINDPSKIRSNLFVLSSLLNYMSNPLSDGHVPRTCTTGSRGVGVELNMDEPSLRFALGCSLIHRYLWWEDNRRNPAQIAKNSC